MENSKYNGSDPELGKETKVHKDVNYWDYYIKTVQIDNTVFNMVANVRRKSNGSYVYTFLFIDKEKSRKLSNPAKVQFFGKLDNYDFNTIIRKTRANVNK